MFEMYKYRYRRTFLFSIGLVFSICIHLSSQSPAQGTIDSLLIILKKSGMDTSRVETLNDLAYAYFKTDPEKTKRYSNEALELAKKLSYRKGIADCHNLTGISFYIQGRYYDAIRHYQQSLDIYLDIDDIKRAAGLYSNLGSAFYKLSEYEKSVEKYIASVELYELLGDKQGTASLYNNLGIIYRSQGLHEKALEYYETALAKIEQIHDIYALGAVYNNMGAVYQEMKQYNKALEYLHKSILYKKQDNNIYGMAITYDGMGTIYIELDELDKANEYFNLSFKIRKELNDRGGIAIVLNNLGSICCKKKQYEKAREYYEKSMAISNEIGTNKTLMNTYEWLAELDSTIGNFKSAYVYYKKYKTLSDRIYSDEKRDKISELQAKYESEKKERELQLLTEQTKIQKTDLAHRNFILVILTLILIFGATAGVLVFRYNKAKSSEKIIQLTQDNLRQQLNPHFVFNTLNSIQNFVFNNNKLETNKYIGKFAKLMRMILENSQNTLTPIQKEIDALKIYLDLEKLRFKDKIEYNINIDSEIDTYNYKIPTLLLQPYIENSIKHGLQNKEGKGKIEIGITKIDSQILCFIEDNGIGRNKALQLKQQNSFSEKSYGTYINEERINLLNSLYGNKLKIRYKDLYHNNSPAGTRVELNIPLMN